MKFFLLICFAVNFAACEISDVSCIDSFLSQPSGSSSEECEKVVEKLSTEFIDSVKSDLGPEDNQTCILDLFENFQVTRLYLRGLLSHITNSIDKYDEDVEESKDALVNAAKVLCTSNSRFDKDFNELFNGTKVNETNEYEKCLQKFFIDEQSINENDFKFNSTDFNQANCDQTYEELRKNFSIDDDEDEKANTFFGLPASKAQQCTSQKFSEFRVMQKIFSFQIIASYWEVTEDQKENLRGKYVDARTSSVKYLFECLKEI